MRREGAGGVRTCSKDFLEQFVRELRVLLLRLAFESVHLSMVSSSLYRSVSTYLVHVRRLVVPAVEEHSSRIQPYNSSAPHLRRAEGRTLVGKEDNHNLGGPGSTIDEITVEEERMRWRGYPRERQEMNKVVKLSVRIPDTVPSSQPNSQESRETSSHVDSLALLDRSLHQRRLGLKHLISSQYDPPGFTSRDHLPLLEPCRERLDKFDRWTRLGEHRALVVARDGRGPVC